MSERIYLYDTTLRDGGQTQGVNFTLDDKLSTISLLETLGLDYIEGGWPGANEVDTQLFAEPRTSKACFSAFGMTKRAGRSLSNDPAFNQVITSSASAVCLVGKASDFQVKIALKTSLADNVRAIHDSISAIVAEGKEALFDCEHFFDGFKSNPDYALECALTALNAGARWIILCDTNGGTMPEDVFNIVSQVTQSIPGERLGIHAHDDTGQAVAVSLAAVRAGVRQIQGTLNGLGERCGNANLVTLLPTLMLKTPFKDLYSTGLSFDQLRELTSVSRRFDALLNQNPDNAAPYVGGRAFAHKGGLHASAMARDTSTYEHVEPDKVGNQRRMLVSDQSGKSNLLSVLNDLGLDVDPADERLDTLLTLIKSREAEGYAYEDATASFELLARQTLDTVPEFFKVESFRVAVERRFNALGELTTVTDAIVKVWIGETRLISVAEGNGPVHALDLALRKDLGLYQSYIDDLELIDFKVRIIDLKSGTEAVTRVTVISRDRRDGRALRTVGVSPNIVEASFEALYEAFIIQLLRRKVKAFST